MSRSADPTLEICCPSADFAVTAEQAGAGRVELCDNLAEGGTTPSSGAIEVALRDLSIPVMVMIRPRGGDFVYSGSEVDVMLRDIESVARLEVNGRSVLGVVVGALTPEGAVDARLIRELVAAARPLAVTFHRAFDLSRDLDESLDTLLEIGVDRVLTSAGRRTAVDGVETLARLAARAGDHAVVLPGGGVRTEHVPRLLGVPGIRELHIGASRWTDSPMLHRVHDVPMGRAYQPDEYVREVVDGDRVTSVAAAMSVSMRPS